MDCKLLGLQSVAARVISPAGLGACLVASLSLPPVFAQGQKAPPGNTTTNSSTSTSMNTPTSNLPSGFQATPQFIIGKVVMDDGNLPPEGTVIERLCGGVTHTEGRTDAKGGFGFEMGHDNLVQDASYNGQATLNPNKPVISTTDIGADPNRPYRNCELRANLPGYRSDSILLATYRPDENPNVGTVMLHRMSGVEGTVISANTAAAPRTAAREYEKGLDLVKKSKPDDAVQAFNKAVETYPGFSAAWFELGKLQAGLQQLADAQKSFEAAIKAEPKFLSPYLQLSEIAFKSKNWNRVIEVTNQLLTLDAVDFPQEYYYNGLANYTLKHSEPAEKSLREVIRLDAQNRYPKAHQFLAAILVTRKDLGGAAEELRNYLKLVPAASDAETARRQLAELDKINRTGETPGK